jgi:non-canonical purine NTP pyrophosphatase (RdgB/HAM1 family)
MHILFATHNQWKTRLFAPVFCGYGFDMVTLNAVAIHLPPPQENGTSALENSLIKAHYYHSEVYPWVFADDAGLEIDALGGQPGVQARRWNGVFSDDVDDQSWLDYLLKRMKNVPVGERTAAFVAGWALLDPAGNAYTRQVRVPFEIALHPIRPISPGSPITAVRLGPVDDLTRRQVEIRTEWNQWRIFEKLLSDYREVG